MKNAIFKDFVVGGIKCNIYLQKLEKNDYLFLIASAYSKKLSEIYCKRWSIDSVFNLSLKNSKIKKKI
ncbi:MAG: hypothetical protein EAZ97_11500 [Bacteroidetes bacterium]|nr:MAG: hypothetical protein EAZ97_11500 [Bacteroidota bacterium]